MALPSGGWLTNEVIGDVIAQLGLLPTIYSATIKQVLCSILTAKENSGNLTSAEKLLQADIYQGGIVLQNIISRITDFVRLDSGGGWNLRGMYMTPMDLTTAIVAAWPNILKKHS
jgi:hypothetical protein